jgi:predicted phage terminase large subunit-like protein
VARALSIERRSLAAASPGAFARIYLPHHFRLPGSTMHDDLFALALEATTQRGSRIAIAAPRGHAKSTVITLAYTLWSVLYGHERFVMIASATKDQASQHLKHIKDELESNPRLREDFPEVLGPDAGKRPAPWRGNKLQLPSGVMLLAVGLGQQIRGLRHREHRPSLVIVDDLEMPEHVSSEDHRAKNREWFEKTLLKAGDDRTNVILVGTVLHYDALLARLLTPTQSPGWTTRRYRALITPPDDPALWATWETIYCDRESHEGVSGRAGAAAFLEAHRDAMHAGARVLWPEKDPLPALMEMRLREGELSFQSEKQNEPLDPDHCLFSADAMRFWDDEFDTVDRLLAHLGSRARFFGAWDPSLGRDPRKGDYSAIVILAQDKDSSVCYVIAADLVRRPPLDAIRLIVEHARIRPGLQLAVEANGFQEGLERDLRAAAETAGIRLRIDAVRNTGEKRGRIELLDPVVRQGMVRFCRRHTLLNEQMRQFPMAAHDDGPDALEMAVQATRVRRARVWIGGQAYPA